MREIDTNIRQPVLSCMESTGRRARDGLSAQPLPSADSSRRHQFIFQERPELRMLIGMMSGMVEAKLEVSITVAKRHAVTAILA
jgi:hypothetical protein